jgi:hypothetical protein
MRLGLSAIAASAVLYSAIVLFGVGPASPTALDADRDPHASAVLIQVRPDTVSGSAQRLPQASPEPRRHHSPTRSGRPRTAFTPRPVPSAPIAVASPTPAAPRETESESPSVPRSTAASVSEPLPSVTLPTVQVPTVTVPALNLPVQLPQLPAPLPLLPPALS